MLVIALNHVLHDGAEYSIGDTLELDDVQAQALIASGSAEPAPAEAKPAKKGKAAG